MIKISKKADYGVLIMASLANRQVAHRDAAGDQTDGASPMPPASAQEISDEVHLSRAMVANLLKSLARADLLDSVRGAGGGYRLARPMDQINLAHIISAVEGPIQLVDCASAPGVAHECNLSDHCPSRTAMRVVHNRIAALMEDIQLPELLRLENRTQSPGPFANTLRS